MGHSSLAPEVEARKDSVRPAYRRSRMAGEVLGEYRAMLRRLLVIQGDIEPASVEQQRHLGKPRPASTIFATCSR